VAGRAVGQAAATVRARRTAVFHFRRRLGPLRFIIINKKYYNIIIIYILNSHNVVFSVLSFSFHFSTRFSYPARRFSIKLYYFRRYFQRSIRLRAEGNCRSSRFAVFSVTASLAPHCPSDLRVRRVPDRDNPRDNAHVLRDENAIFFSRLK